MSEKQDNIIVHFGRKWIWNIFGGDVKMNYPLQGTNLREPITYIVMKGIIGTFMLFGVPMLSKKPLIGIMISVSFLYVYFTEYVRKLLNRFLNIILSQY